MQTIKPIWIRLKLMILFSVLRTVLMFRFSRVRKYFWLRVMVESWPEILKTDSSSTDVCSGELPCLDGRLTRASFSTCRGHATLVPCKSSAQPRRLATYSNLEVDVFIRIRAHLVAEAELILADVVGTEDEVALSLILTIQNDLARGAGNLVIDIERASGLHLHRHCHVSRSRRESANPGRRTAK